MSSGCAKSHHHLGGKATARGWESNGAAPVTYKKNRFLPVSYRIGRYPDSYKNQKNERGNERKFRPALRFFVAGIHYLKLVPVKASGWRGETMSSGPNQAAPTPPNLAELFQRYLRQQVGAQAAGLGVAELAGEVTPYEAVPAQPIEPRLAWSETLFAISQFGASERSFSPVPEWPNLVALHDPCYSLSLSAANFPQRVRNLQPLLQAKRLSDLRGHGQQPIELEALLEWTRQTIQKKLYPQMLLSVGLLRMCRQFKAALQVFDEHKTMPADMNAAWENEHAALYWEQGESEKAKALWQKQASHAGVQFNIGMAALFTDRPADAKTPLQASVRQLPESSGWHHLARLYLALAEMRAE